MEALDNLVTINKLNNNAGNLEIVTNRENTNRDLMRHLQPLLPDRLNRSHCLRMLRRSFALRVPTYPLKHC